MFSIDCGKAMIHTKSILVLLLLLFAADFTQAQTVLIDGGKFRFYETKQIRGEETYQINQLPNGDLLLEAKTDLPFVEQENKALVNATLRTSKDLTPESFTIKGPTFLDIQEATSITIQGKTASIQDRGNNKSIETARNYFTMSGYVPVSVEAMLIRYWLAHGRPASIALLPAGEAFVRMRGKESLTVSGKPIELTRYHLSGKNWRSGWGRQTLWLDGENRLVAAVHLAGNLETNYYAFRDGYESSMSFFLKRAVEDAIDRKRTRLK